MILSPHLSSAEPFFLDATPGQRFCLFHPPATSACRGAVLYVHPFADEMNKSRRMAALQARDLAAAGFGVLQIDLYGCGDSSGEFGDARWAIWKQDLALATKWLRSQLGKPVTLLGLRLGALLALDYANDSAQPIARVVLWQPVQNGATFLKQFLRLLTANEILSDDQGDSGSGARALRAALLGGQMLEVGGYDIAPELAAAIDTTDASQLALTRCPVDWFEAVASPERPTALAVTRLANLWQQEGVSLALHRVASPPFWATQEISDSAELIAATTALLIRSSHALSRTGA